MIFTVDAGKLKIWFDDPDTAIRIQQLQLLIRDIGSAHPIQKDDDDEAVLGVSCALSIANLRKLKQLFPDTKRGSDSFTDEVVAKMRADLTVYEEESRHLERIKREGPVPPPNYTFKMPPFQHQLVGNRGVREIRNLALFGDCGTGKTFMVSTAMDALAKAGEKWVTLVLCPVNLIKHVWQEDIAKFTDLTSTSLRVEHWDKAKKQALLKEAFAADTDVYIVNPENAKTINKSKVKQKSVMDLLRRRRKQGYKIAIAIDESSKMKSKESAAYRATIGYRTVADKCVIMSGTPAPKGVLDLWAQFHILDQGMTLQPSYTDFRHQYCHQIPLKGVEWIDKRGQKQTAMKWSERKGAAALIHQIVRPRALRFRLDDCIDLPKRRYLVRDVVMDADQDRVYQDLEERLFAELEGGDTVTARVAAAKLMKLREVTGGFVINDDGQALPLGKDTPKMRELDELLRQSVADKMGDEGPPIKAIIWAQYQWECKELVKRYSREYGARGLFGGISSGAKDDAIRLFKTDPAARILVCHPASVGHGLTLIQASYAFYYSLSYNYEELYQSTRRIVRPGQTRPMTFYFLQVPGTIDEDIIEALAERKDVSDMITDGRFDRADFVSRRKTRKPVTSLSIEWEDANDLPPGVATPAPESRPAPG